MGYSKLSLPLALLLVLSLSSFASVDYDKYQSVDMNVVISSSFKIYQSSSDYSIDYIRTEVSFIPRASEYQQISSINYDPEAQIDGDIARFEWLRPSLGDYSFKIDSDIKTNNQIGKVKDKISFPMRDIPSDIEKYTQPSDNIDSGDENIHAIASDLASGEDDSYIVANKIGSWVENNIEYSLSSLTADSSQKASWVLKNKKGVCDELSSLFIAMCRSVGIPARYVSGVAYTNYDAADDWGPHAWAEVYYPGYGWVPYDVTYKQLGRIDPSHVVLKYSIDSDESSTNYEWKALNVKMNTNKLSMKVKDNGRKEDTSQYVGLEANVEKDKVRFGSSNLIGVLVKNNNDFYYSTEISLAHIKDMTIYGDLMRNVVLKPHEEKKIYWKIKVSENLDDKFVYTIPIVVYTSTNITAKTEFTSRYDDPYYSNDNIDQIMQQKAEEEKKVYSREVSISCAKAKDFYYAYDNPEIDCSIENKGNVILEGLDVCLDKQSCTKIDLGIASKKMLNFSFIPEKAGTKNLVISASNSLISKSFNLDVEVLDTPKVMIGETINPNSVKYDDMFNISFLVKKSSESNPKNVEIILQHKGDKSRWTISDMQKDERFIVSLSGKNLDIGENKFNITVNYYDLNAKPYQETEPLSINLKDVNIFQRFLIMLNGIGRWAGSLFS